VLFQENRTDKSFWEGIEYWQSSSLLPSTPPPYPTYLPLAFKTLTEYKVSE